MSKKNQVFIGFLLMGASDILYELRLLNKKKTQD